MAFALEKSQGEVRHIEGYFNILSELRSRDTQVSEKRAKSQPTDQRGCPEGMRPRPTLEECTKSWPGKITEDTPTVETVGTKLPGAKQVKVGLA